MRLTALISAAILSLFSGAYGARIDSISWQASIEGAFSGGSHSPFWFETNRQGLPSSRTDNGYVRLSASKAMDSSRRFTWGAAVDIAVPWRGQSPWVIQQLYGEVRYRCLGAMLGSKEMWGEFNDPFLSSGNVLYSGNSRPIPQLRVGIFDYADFWGTNGWLGVKGYLAYGKFTDAGWQKSWADPGTMRNTGVMYCSREIMFRIGKEKKFPLVYEFGLEMGTQFAGDALNYNGPGTYIKMPDDFMAWIKAFLPQSGGKDTHKGEQTNVQGNMTGSWYTRLSWLPAAGWNIRAYYEHYFEDHSMMFMEYPWKDGLIGVETELPANPFVSKIVYEYLYTKDQAGPVNWDKTDKIPGQVSGADLYYQHYLYTGWQHWGMSIGTPLCMSPVFNPTHRLSIISNRVIAHHIGISGRPLPELDWRLLLSYTRSWGSYVDVYPEVKKAFNGLLEVSWRPRRLHGWEGTIGLGLDHGDLMGNTAGLMIRISRSGLFRF